MSRFEYLSDLNENYVGDHPTGAERERERERENTTTKGHRTEPALQPVRGSGLNVLEHDAISRKTTPSLILDEVHCLQVKEFILRNDH